ncbi:hypothetical protein HAT91_02277 [Dickeya solani]|nr:hypothetical protein HAT91_02277 [Dickeya solani]
MRFTLADEFEFIAGNQIYQCIGDRPKQACRAIVPLMNIDSKLLSVSIPFQPPRRTPRLKYLIDHSEVHRNTVHGGFYHRP